MEQKALTQFKDLTLKQKKFLKLYIELGNATEAAFQVYDCKGNRDVAHAIGSENLRKLPLEELMEEMGLTKQGIIKVVAAGITKPTRKIVRRTKTIKIDDKTTETIYEYDDVPDYQTRHKYLETATKLNKSIDNSSEKVDIENLTFIFGTPNK